MKENRQQRALNISNEWRYYKHDYSTGYFFKSFVNCVILPSLPSKLKVHLVLAGWWLAQNYYSYFCTKRILLLFLSLLCFLRFWVCCFWYYLTWSFKVMHVSVTRLKNFCFYVPAKKTSSLSTLSSSYNVNKAMIVPIFFLLWFNCLRLSASGVV